jgi:hypothetical protein
MNHALRWQKSTFSGGGEGNTCVELAAISPHLLGLRESDAPGAILTIAPALVTELLRAIAAGQFTPLRP